MEKMVDPEGIHCVRRKFEFERLLSVNLIPMGANLVLINPMEGEILKETLNERRKVFEKWFTEIRPWNPGLEAKKRSIWLKFLRVAAHVWSEGFFKRISQPMGTFITIDDSIRDKARLDVGKALIFTSLPDNINRTVVLKVNDVIFAIRVIEEPSGDNFNTFYSDRRFQQSEEGSSDEDGSIGDSVLAVPELTGDCRDDDLQHLYEEYSNQDFGKISNLEAMSEKYYKGSLGDRAVHRDLPLQSEKGTSVGIA